MEEFYEEEDSKKKIIITFAVIAIFFIVVIVMFNNYRKKYTLNIKSKLTFEAGDKVSYDVSDYITNDVLSTQDYTLYLNSIPITDGVFTTTGEYEFQVAYKNIKKSGKITIEDTKGPEVTTTDLTVGVSEEFMPSLFVSTCTDYSMPCDVEYKNPSDASLNSKAGMYTVDIVISDIHGNKTNKSVKLTVKEGYSLYDTLVKDTTLNYIDPSFDDFDGTYFIKFDEAIEEDEIMDSDEYDLLLECMDKGWRRYLPEMYSLNRIDEEDIITAYNKYGYAIGYAVRVKLDNKQVLYLTRN